MELQIPKAVFKAKACELFRQVEALGVSLIVTDHGKPSIEVRRYTGSRKNPLDMLRTGIVHFEPDTTPPCAGRAARTR